MLRRLLPLCLFVWLVAVPGAHAQDARSADWLRTVRETPLWSGADAAAVQFTRLPLGSFVQPRAGSETGRLLVYYPGDSGTRQAGLAWLAVQDVAPSGPPPWIVSSELDGDNAELLPADQSAPRRTLPLAPPRVTASEAGSRRRRLRPVAVRRAIHTRTRHRPAPPRSPRPSSRWSTPPISIRRSGSASTDLPWPRPMAPRSWACRRVSA